MRTGQRDFINCAQPTPVGVFGGPATSAVSPRLFWGRGRPVKPPSASEAGQRAFESLMKQWREGEATMVHVRWQLTPEHGVWLATAAWRRGRCENSMQLQGCLGDNARRCGTGCGCCRCTGIGGHGRVEHGRGLARGGGPVRGQLVGAAVAVFSSPADAACYSLIAGVSPGAESRGIGLALKLAQRAWALRAGA